MNVSRVHCTRRGLKVKVKKIKPLRLGISEGNEVILVSNKIDQVHIFTYLSSIISAVKILEVE